MSIPAVHRSMVWLQTLGSIVGTSGLGFYTHRLRKVAFPLACRLLARNSEGPLQLSGAALPGFTAACRLEATARLGGNADVRCVLGKEVRCLCQLPRLSVAAGAAVC